VFLVLRGVEAPQWSVRASLANLRDEQYEQIGRSLAAIGRQYVEEWQKARERALAPARQWCWCSRRSRSRRAPPPSDWASRTTPHGPITQSGQG
jgi:hypothetical protein